MSSKKTTALAVLLVVSAVAYLLSCSPATWSPDGKQIAFISKIGDGKERYYLYVASTESGKVRCLWKSMTFLGAPSWSPGGKSLVVTRTALLGPRKEADTKGLPVAEGAQNHNTVLADRLHVINVATGKRRVVAEQKFIGSPDLAHSVDGRPFSPFSQWVLGGKAILWQLADLKQVRMVDAKNGKLIKQWTDIEGAPVVVSPSGKLAAAFRDSAGSSKMSLVVLDIEKKEPLLTRSFDKKKIDFEPFMLLAWSPDSLQLVLGVEAKKRPIEPPGRAIWIMDLKSGQLRRIILKGLYAMPIWVDWSSKGDRLAVGGLFDDKDFPSKGKGGVWLVKADGSDLKRLDQSKGPKEMAYHPTFSPDGSRVCWRVMNNAQPAAQAVVYDIAKGTRTTVALKLPKPASPTKEKPDDKKPAGASDPKEKKTP